MDPSHFAPWTPTRHCHDVELGRLPVPSGLLAIRDVYDLDHPQVVLALPPGGHRVWATEFDVRSVHETGNPLLRPAYLSVRVSNTVPVRVGSADALCCNNIPSPGASVRSDLGIIAVHDAEAVAAADMEGLDARWEAAWESTSDYADVHTDRGARVITCKTVRERTRLPLLASFDAEGLPVAIHIDFGVVDTVGTDQLASDRWVAAARKVGAAAGRWFPRLFQQRR